MFGHEVVIAQMRVGGAYTVDLRKLAWAERFVLVETPEAFEQALAAQDFVQTGDATSEAVGRIEEGGIAIGYFEAETQ